MPVRSDFKRMIVGLPQAAGDYALVGVPAKLAELLRLDLVAMFADDRSLLHVAGLPCVRELRPLGGGWQTIDALQLRSELESSVATARRLFAKVVDHCSIETSFHVEQGSAAKVIGSLATAEDIVVIFEPSNPAARVTHQFTGLVETAFESAASVMIVPSRVNRSSGPVVVVAAAADDSSIEAAIRIAVAAREKLLVIGPECLASLLPMSRAGLAGIGVEFLATASGSWDAAGVAGGLGRRSERLIIVTRGALEDTAARRLASLRSVPIMVIEPNRRSA